MGKHIILAIHITDRLKHAGQVQQLLTEYGNHIKTRLGLHDVDTPSPNGVLLLEMHGNEDRIGELKGKLAQVEGIEVKEVVF